MTSRQPLRIAAFALALAAGGCSSLPSWMPTIPAPSFDWFTGSTKAPGPLPELAPSVTPVIAWQAQVGKAAAGFAPMVTPDAIYAAAADGTVMRIDPANGRAVWRISAGRTLSAGAGADGSVVVVGSDKGDVLAFDANGTALWATKVGSEVISPPKTAEGTVVVFSGDGRVYGLSTKDGSRRWVYQRANPPLIVRNYAGAVIERGGVFFGTAGGRLLGLDLATGTVGWEAAIATPKGATELERIADVTSLPTIDERYACATAYQGRTGCFDVVRGTPVWTRDIGSLGGIAIDGKNLYVTDDAGAVHALDRSTGASVWKQDKLAQRRIGGPQLVADHVGVVDVEGWLHLISPINGAYVGRVATDGSAPTSQPAATIGGATWQSAGGTVFSVRAR
ncbi:MAG: outer membrane protein assembly factor BamB [Burkholderiales bacterium]|jgi:outer membrane protein assembly factor BamB|nr:outer membrane protein assembly factor BamB [Burkholderiales bacterium]